MKLPEGNQLSASTLLSDMMDIHKKSMEPEPSDAPERKLAGKRIVKQYKTLQSKIDKNKALRNLPVYKDIRKRSCKEPKAIEHFIDQMLEQLLKRQTLELAQTSNQSVAMIQLLKDIDNVKILINIKNSQEFQDADLFGEYDKVMTTLLMKKAIKIAESSNQHEQMRQLLTDINDESILTDIQTSDKFQETDIMGEYDKIIQETINQIKHPHTTPMPSEKKEIPFGNSDNKEAPEPLQPPIKSPSLLKKLFGNKQITRSVSSPDIDSDPMVNTSPTPKRKPSLFKTLLRQKQSKATSLPNLSVNTETATAPPPVPKRRIKPLPEPPKTTMPPPPAPAPSVPERSATRKHQDLTEADRMAGVGEHLNLNNPPSLSVQEQDHLASLYGVRTIPVMINGKEIGYMLTTRSTDEEPPETLLFSSHASGKENREKFKNPGFDNIFFATPRNKILRSRTILFAQKLAEGHARFPDESQIYSQQQYITDYKISGGINTQPDQAAKQLHQMRTQPENVTNHFDFLLLDRNVRGLHFSDLLNAMHNSGLHYDRMVCHMCRPQDANAPYYDVSDSYENETIPLNMLTPFHNE
ncbi:hypothetical protein CI610_00272 [invertebrate metagenome]|uniref:Putative adhesin Stv domain-containing protein n=1 Tax=invertebrate metagenome TaxID=1711999 RepID=A0A2H9TBV3_9ZZZZ